MENEVAALSTNSEEMVSFLWIVRAWLLDCSAHGVPRVIGTTNFKRKLFWLAAVTTSACLLLWQIGTMWQDVSSHPITVNLQVLHRRQLNFPAVTICNSNKLKYSKIISLEENLEDAKTSPYVDGLQKAFAFSKMEAIGLRFAYYKLVTQVAGEEKNTDLIGKCHADRFDLGLKEQTDESTSNRSDQVEPLDLVIGADPSDIRLRVSPNNQFECEDGSCVSQADMCDGILDCLDGSDESTDLCGTCPSSTYECKSGKCINPKLRCDGKFDCDDGSDENPQICTRVDHSKDFVCCHSDTIIPRAFLCDGYDDCPRDKSDQFLDSCNESMRGLETGNPDTYFCPMAGVDYDEGQFNLNISKSQIGDGVMDCQFGIDETCLWKNNLEKWVNPFRSNEQYLQYRSFLLKSYGKPSWGKWYTMAAADELKKLGHSYQDLILTCRANGKECNETASITDTFSQKYGMCYTFNFCEPVTNFGQNFGLSFAFNLEVFDYLGLFTMGSGLKLFVTPQQNRRDPGHSTFVDWSNEINIPPGFDHYISIHPVKVHKLGAPFSNCELYGEGSLANFHNKDDCLFQCEQRAKTQKCNCSDDVRFDESELCTIDMVSERICVEEMSSTFSPSDECHCPAECESATFDTSISQLEWPSNKSLANFMTKIPYEISTSLQHFLINVIEKYWKDKIDGSQNAVNALRSNFGRVNIYLRDLSETLIRERPVYEVVTILSNIGGLLGLYLGFSMLTLLELVDFGFDLVEYFRIQGHNKSLHTKNSNTEDVKTKLTPTESKEQQDMSRPPSYVLVQQPSEVDTESASELFIPLTKENFANSHVVAEVFEAVNNSAGIHLPQPQLQPQPQAQSRPSFQNHFTTVCKL